MAVLFVSHISTCVVWSGRGLIALPPPHMVSCRTCLLSLSSIASTPTLHQPTASTNGLRCPFRLPPDIVKVVKGNKVETGLAGGAAVINASGGGGRRAGRGRNPKNMIAVIAAETSLEIPEAFKQLVSGMRCFDRSVVV